MQNIIHFIKYHNFFTLAIVVVFVGGGTAFAASPELREVAGDALIGKTEVIVSVDNTALLNTDFDNFDPQLVITEVSEDEDEDVYYISYTFNTLAVLDGAWGNAIKDGELTVSKDSLNNTDLQAYVEEELKEVAQAEISYLKEVKTVEQKKGNIKKTIAVAYTGLLGLVIDTKEKEVEYKTLASVQDSGEAQPEPTPTPTVEPTTNLETEFPSTAIATSSITVSTSTPNQSSQSSDATRQATSTPSDSNTQDIQVATSTSETQIATTTDSVPVRPERDTATTTQPVATTTNATTTQSAATTTLPIVEMATST